MTTSIAMNRHVQSRKRLGSALLTLTALAAAIHAHAQEAGVLAGLKGSVTVYRNDQSLTANSGEPIFPGDRIESGSGQLFQLLLRDESTFTFGEGSVISLDKFEYDAHKNSGNLQITQESGQLKFATGRIADGSLSAFRILQPSTEVAVLGTMGVTAILSPDQVSMHFPDIQLPPDSGPLSYSSLMGPGPYSSIPTGTFVVTAEGQSITVDQPEGSVIAAEGMPPVFFFAPPLTFERPQTSAEDDSEQSESTLSNVTADDPADNRAEKNSNRKASDESRQQSRRESQQYIDDLQVQRIIERMETRFGLPDEFDPAFTPEQPAESPSQPGPPFPQEPEPQEPEPEEPAIEPEPPVTEPQEPGTGSGLPTNPGGDPLDPIGPGTGLDPLDPGPGMICPGDPECP